MPPGFLAELAAAGAIQLELHLGLVELGIAARGGVLQGLTGHERLAFQDVQAPEGCFPGYLPVRHRIHCTAARQRKVRQAIGVVQVAQQMKESLLVHGLRGPGDRDRGAGLRGGSTDLRREQQVIEDC